MIETKKFFRNVGVSMLVNLKEIFQGNLREMKCGFQIIVIRECIARVSKF